VRSLNNSSGHCLLNALGRHENKGLHSAVESRCHELNSLSFKSPVLDDVELAHSTSPPSRFASALCEFFLLKRLEQGRFAVRRLAPVGHAFVAELAGGRDTKAAVDFTQLNNSELLWPRRCSRNKLDALGGVKSLLAREGNAFLWGVVLIIQGCYRTATFRGPE
jgi:hypothetical protein